MTNRRLCVIVYSPDSPYVPPIVSRLRNLFQIVVGSTIADFPPSMLGDGVETVMALANPTISCDVLDSALKSNANLRWVHSIWTGLDGFKLEPVAARLTEKGVRVSNTRGSFAPSLAEHVLLSCLYFNRQVPRMRDATFLWDRYRSPMMKGQSAVILGYGKIGGECARVLRLHGMNVTGVRTRAGNETDGVRIVDMKGLWDVLPGADFVVNVLPLTNPTRHAIHAAHFAAMKPSAVFINIGRGGTTVEADVAAALRDGKIKGAALDVFETEPFAKDSPFVDVPRDKLLLTPHNADVVDGVDDDAALEFVEAAENFVRTGAFPEYIVDLSKGY